MNEQEIKQEMAQRMQPDHLEIEAGSAAKGIKVTLKTYYNALNVDEAQKKVDCTLKIRGYLIKVGLIQ